MVTPFIKHALAGVLLVGALSAAAQGERVAIKRPVDVPPSVDLIYSIKARQKGFGIIGEAEINWRVIGNKYTLRADTRAAVFGNLIENRSEGVIDSYGIAPLQFSEKRIRQDPWTTTFERGGKGIRFTGSTLVYPLKGGEQDRSSVSWQLVALARAAPQKFIAGSEWTFFVAGRRDAEPWTFKVIKRESVATGLGPVDTVHLVKLPPPDAHGQTVDIWLAPSYEWYPVRLRFSDSEDESVDQVLEKIVKK